MKEVIEIIALGDITDNMTKMGTDLVLQTSEDQKQKAREFLSLSVAVVLGFNIGGGNRRDKLSSGNKIIKLHSIKQYMYLYIQLSSCLLLFHVQCI